MSKGTVMYAVPSTFVSPAWINKMYQTPNQRHFNPTATGQRLHNILADPNPSTIEKRGHFLEELRDFTDFQQAKKPGTKPPLPPPLPLPAVTPPPVPPTSGLPPSKKIPAKKKRTPVNQLQDLLHPDTAPVSRRTRSRQRGTGIQQYVSYHPVASKRCIHVPR